METKDTVESSKEDKSAKKSKKSCLKNVNFGVAMLIIAGLLSAALIGFIGGAQYGKNLAESSRPDASIDFDDMLGYKGSSRGNMRQGGNLSTVTKVSEDSITILYRQTLDEKTYSVSDETTITEDGKTIDLTEINTGDVVLVSVSSSDSDAAASIIVNPQTNMRGMSQSLESNLNDKIEVN